MGNFSELESGSGTYSQDYIYTVDHPTLSIISVTNDSMVLQVKNDVNNVGELKTYLEIGDSSPDESIGIVDTGEYTLYTFTGLDENQTYTVYSMFEDQRNGSVSDVSSISFTTLPNYYLPNVTFHSGSSTSLSFKVTNVSLSNEPLTLYGELGNSIPNNYIAILERNEYYIITYSNLTPKTNYVFYAYFRDQNGTAFTGVTSRSIKTLPAYC